MSTANTFVDLLAASIALTPLPGAHVEYLIRGADLVEDCFAQ